MDNHKPLPALPTTQTPVTLSTDARAHRSQLIRHILSESQDPAIESRQDGWTLALEEALEELSRCIVKEDWLAGIRRSRESKLLASLLAEKASNVPEPKKGQEVPKVSRPQSPDSVDPPPVSPPALAVPSMEDRGISRAHSEEVLRQLRMHISSSDVSSSEQQQFHLLLCLAPPNAQSRLSTESYGFDIIPANIGCTFTPKKYLLPPEMEQLETAVLCGVNEWDTKADPSALSIVGGTFFLKGTDGSSQHEALAKVLRISIYIHLSLLLEQQFLSDSHAHIRLPRPKFVLPSSPAPSKKGSDTPQTSEEAKEKHHSPFLPPGILSFFSRKKSLTRRAQTFNQTGSRGSLDLISNPSDLVQDGGRLHRSSIDSGVSRLTRFSFVGERWQPVRPAPPLKEDHVDSTEGPFRNALRHIEHSKSLLSTSVGVTFPPPLLITELAAKESKNPNRRLRGDEKAGLTSLLAWSGKDMMGRSMFGTPGFLHQQEFSFLQSRHVLHPTSSSPAEIPETISQASTISSPSNMSPISTLCCGRPQWLTYHYYSHDIEDDKRLGEAILDFLSRANMPCNQPGCTSKCGQHETRLTHGGYSIRIKVEITDEIFQPQPNLPIRMWESCAICKLETVKSTMSHGAYLKSYAKFLELLIYSSSLCTLSPSLCEHTKPPNGPWTQLPESRLNIIRNFGILSGTVSFSITTIDDVFELQVPRLQMYSSGERPLRTSSDHDTPEDDPEEVKKSLRREINRWWEGIADHMDKLELLLAGEDSASIFKALPRLPSADNAYTDFEDPSTPKARLVGLPPSIPPNTPTSSPSANHRLKEDNTPSHAKEHDPSSVDNDDQTSSITEGIEESPAPDPEVEQQSSEGDSETPTPSVLTSSTWEGRDPSELLDSLRHAFQRAEHSLYAHLSRTPVNTLNDVRRAFLSTAKGAQKRLNAWQKKHLKAHSDLLKDIDFEEPGWWDNKCHAVPGCNTIVREDDWGSIIAFTLSSADYHRELANLSANRTSPAIPPPAPSRNTSSGPSSFFTAGKLFGSLNNAQLDPDRDDVVWHEPEAYSAAISRKDHTRDPTSILSIREVLRQKSPIDPASGLPSSKGSESQVNLASVYAKPDVGISMEAAGGEVSIRQVMAEGAGKILHDLESVASGESGRSETESYRKSATGSTSGHVQTEATEGEGQRAEDVQHPASPSLDQHSTTSSNLFDAHIKRGKTSSVLSLESEATVGPQDAASVANVNKPPTPPPKGSMMGASTKELPPTPEPAGHQPTSSSSFANTITSSLSMAMRFVMNQPEPSKAAPPPPKKHHNLLLVDANNIDERPHIKYDWTIGKRLKFSCTVYYARQFDLMRKRCGVDDTFLKSLSRSVNWTAAGGKSRSNFWKTTDDRFIIKTLVNAWNVADLQVLIELAPSYFRYIESTASKASVLAKLLGFYTIEIRNLETGAIQSKADLLVTENLFFNRNINKTFDLKGIQGRKVKAKQDGNETSKTLFDGEWIEGQQRTLILLHPHSKNVLREAIRSDAEFLAKSNIMDYSLLLGIDEEKKQIACGLVDTIGSYTFAKTLEYKAKHNLHSGKDVTVIPPAGYQERFVNTLEEYFVACPDKWSKSLDESKTINDPFSLPSVL